MSKDSLYHYTSCTGLKGIINEKTIRATHIRYFNDGREFVYTSNLLRDIVSHLNASTSKINKSLETLLDVVNSVERSENVIPFVSCFTKKGDSLALWTRYCKYGDAYNLGFDFAYFSKFVGINYTNKLVIQLIECIYEVDEQKKSINTYIQKHHRILSEGLCLSKNSQELRQCIGDFFYLAVQLKDPSFEDEEEYRLVFFLPVALHKVIKYKDAKTTKIPYIDFKFAKDNENISVDVITIGPNSDMTATNNELRSFLDRNNMTDCCIKETKTSYREL